MSQSLYNDVKELFAFAESDTKRVGTGIPAIDEAIRGPAPGEVCMIMGRSYSGKSIVGQNIIHYNKTLPSIFFSMEMPKMQAVIRLYSMWSGSNSTDVQLAIEDGSPPLDMWDMIKDFPYHKIEDQPGITIQEMSKTVDEFQSTHKKRPEFVVVDYLELLGGAKASGEGYLATEMQATMLKDWAKQEEMRVFLVHQTNRLERQWMPPTEDSARNAGFTEADFVIGLWRPHKNPTIDFLEKLRTQHIIAANVLKNRPFFKEIDLVEIKLKQGSLRIWRPDDANDRDTVPVSVEESRPDAY